MASRQFEDLLNHPNDLQRFDLWQLFTGAFFKAIELKTTFSVWNFTGRLKAAFFGSALFVISIFNTLRGSKRRERCSHDDLAMNSGMSVPTVKRLEAADGDTWLRRNRRGASSRSPRSWRGVYPRKWRWNWRPAGKTISSAQMTGGSEHLSRACRWVESLGDGLLWRWPSSGYLALLERA
jgi:hypothetical protein